MLKIAGISYQDFINFLNNELPTNEVCYMVYLPSYDSVEGAGGNKGFAAYVDDGEYHIIYVPGNCQISGLSQKETENIILENIAHEYVHFVQNLAGKFDTMTVEELDDEADVEAGKLVNKYNDIKIKQIYGG